MSKRLCVLCNNPGSYVTNSKICNQCRSVADPSICKVDGCSGPIHALLLCNKHWKLWNKYKAFEAPPRPVLAHKQCAECKRVLPYECFYKRGGSRKGYRSKCKSCMNEYTYKHSVENRDAYNEKAKRWRRENKRGQLSASLKYRFGITIEQYEDMLNEQNGACAICEIVPEHTLHVDHCHETQTIRGLLCRACNTMLGHAADRVEVLRSAIAYLENP